MKRIVLLAALAVSFVAAAPVAADPPPMKLVNAGKGTLQKLRFAPKKGDKATTTLTTTNNTARGLRGKVPPLQPVSTTTMVIDIDVTDVKPDGDFRYDYVYRKADLTPAKGAIAVDKSQGDAMAKLVGIKAYAVMSNRGVTKEAVAAVPADAPPGIKQAIEALSTSIPTGLPEEAVGVGAKWESTSTITSGEVTLTQTLSIELKKLDGGLATLAVSVKSTGKGSGAGNLTTATTATGELVLDLSKVVSNGKLETRTDVGLDMDGKRLVQTNTSTLTIKSVAR